MEQETILKEILHVLKLHSEKMDKKFEQNDSRFEQMDERFEQMDKKFEQKIDQLNAKLDKRFDQLDTKIDGVRLDLTATQKTTNFLLSKIADHEEKLLQLSEQQR